MTQTDPPLVSVIVAIHNVADQIHDAVTSIAAQTLADFEVLLIDDGSTDGSGRVAMESCAGDPRFRLITQQNQGLSGARNTGLSQARGRFIAFLDGDDALAPDFLSLLHATLEAQGTDWAACAIELAFPDGSRISHPALHATPGLEAAQTLRLSDAREAVKVFPSAWNKLYRRSLFDGLRFSEGTWYEDHEVFWAIAARAPDLGYTPEALYIHRRERPGQITGSDDDRVFDQLRVLDRLHGRIMAMEHGREGFDRLATRLIHERAGVVIDRARRTRFLTAAYALFDRLGVMWSPDWDPDISRALGMALAGELALSVVVLDPEPAETLERLDRSVMGNFEVLVTAPDAPDVLASGQAVRRIDPRGLTPEALSREARGRWVILLAPGELPERDGMKRLVNLAAQTGCDLAIGAFTREGRGYHDGWTNTAALGVDLSGLPAEGGEFDMGAGAVTRQYPALANRIVRRDVLADMPGQRQIGSDPLSVQLLVIELSLAARRTAYTRLPVARCSDWLPQRPGLFGLRRALAGAEIAPPGLPQGWRGQVYLRLLRVYLRLLRVTGLRGRWRWALAAALVLLSGWGPGDARRNPHIQPDPETPRGVQRVLALARR